jgi:hypothetical protein
MRQYVIVFSFKSIFHYEGGFDMSSHKVFREVTDRKPRPESEVVFFDRKKFVFYRGRPARPESKDVIRLGEKELALLERMERASLFGMVSALGRAVGRTLRRKSTMPTPGLD